MFKKFSHSLYESNDGAKIVAIQYFTSIGKHAIVNPDDYGIDLIVDGRFYCEVEVKHNWDKDEFPFKTLQVPFRKMKFVNLDKPSFFMVINKHRTRAIVVGHTALLDSPVVEVPNKYLPEGEKFFQVPFQYLKFINLHCSYKEH